jgi:glutaredoxin
MYQLKVISLQGCPYSQNTENLLNQLKIDYDLNRINAIEKDKYKSNLISTFPQIYLTKNNQSLLLGGNSDLEEIIKNINLKNINQIKFNLSKKYPKFSEKAILRLIEVFLRK